MKRALIILVPLAAVVIAAVIALTSPAVRSKSGSEQWTGHVVPFHLPMDAAIGPDGKPGPPERAWPEGPYKPVQGPLEEEEFIDEGALTDEELNKLNAQRAAARRAPLKAGDTARITLMQDGTIYYHVAQIGRVGEGGLDALGATLRTSTAAGIKYHEIDADGALDAVLVVRVMALCHSNGSWPPSVAAGMFFGPPNLSDKLGPITAYTPPRVPRVAGAMPHTMPHPACVTVVLDGATKRMVLLRRGEPAEAVDQAQLYARLKTLAAQIPSPSNRQLSELTVLVHIGRDVSWSWFGMVLEDCAKIGIWRIEAVATHEK